MRMDKSKFIKIATSIGVSSFLLTGCGDYEEETARKKVLLLKQMVQNREMNKKHYIAMIKLLLMKM